LRLLVARWSALLLTTEESARALQDLAAQAEELSTVFVEFDAGRRASNYVGGERRKRLLLWSRAFAVALEEALIDKAVSARPSVSVSGRLGRNLLPLADRRKLEDHVMAAGCLRRRACTTSIRSPARLRSLRNSAAGRSSAELRHRRGSQVR
jgi:hypothetical protein